MNKGAETYNQIYAEGESTWGCKFGVLDVEDVIKLVEEIEHHISKHEYSEAGNICLDFMRNAKLSSLTGGEGK